MAEVGGEAVGDIHRGGGQAQERAAQLQPGLRRAVAVAELEGLVLRQGEAAQHAQAHRSIAQRAGDPDLVAGPGTRAAECLAFGDGAQDGEGERERAGGRDGVAAQEVEAEALLIGGEAAGEPPRARRR